MIVVVEERNLSQEMRLNIISILGSEALFCNPNEIASYPAAEVVFADIYFEALSFCLVRGIVIKFFYRDRILSRDDIEYIGLMQEGLLKANNYADLKKLNIMKIFLEVSSRHLFLSSFPSHIQLEHTTYCNARCIMCDHYISHNREAKHLKLATALRLKPILPYVSLIVMHGNGEPFLNPDILEILELYKKYGVRITTNTNLSHINGDICSELNQMCDSLQISCDGCDKETYEGIRQGLSFEIFCNNLESISALSGIRKTSLEVVLMQQNIRKARDFVKFASYHGIKTIKFHDLGINKIIGNEKYSLRSCPDIANKYISLAREEGARLGVSVESFEYDTNGSLSDESCLYSVFPDCQISDEMYRKYDWYTNVIAINEMSGDDLACCKNNYYGICEYPFAKSYMDLNGNVSVCCPSSRKVVGHVSSAEDFAALWNSETMIKIRDEFYSGMMPSFCQNCFMISENSLSWLNHRGDLK